MECRPRTGGSSRLVPGAEPLARRRFAIPRPQDLTNDLVHWGLFTACSGQPNPDRFWWCSRSVQDPIGLGVVEAGDRRDVDAFAEWVSPQLAAMANLAARMVGLSDRDDVVQESLTRAWRRWETFDPNRGLPRTWLLAIVADRARRHNRRRLRPVFSATPSQTDSGGDCDVLAAVQRLPRRQRMAVELHYLVDLPVSEVSELMGCSEGTIKSTLHDARHRLRQLLEEP